jgi:hypothetical protein
MKKDAAQRPANAQPSRLNLFAIGLELEASPRDTQTPDGEAIAVQIKKGQPMKRADALGPDYSVDKRRQARQEHTNHFTSRAPSESK